MEPAHISPEEDALFTKALRFLYERLAENHGFTVEVTPRRTDES